MCEQQRRQKLKVMSPSAESLHRVIQLVQDLISTGPKVEGPLGYTCQTLQLPRALQDLATQLGDSEIA